MREIKFRGKRNDNGKWVYGYLTHIGVIGSIMVDPKSVGQYIGRENKNGKEIWEGDILKPTKSFYGGDPDFLGIVEWSDGDTEFQVITDHPQNASYWIDWAEPEVVGNITDNPKLIKKWRV